MAKYQSDTSFVKQKDIAHKKIRPPNSEFKASVADTGPIHGTQVLPLFCFPGHTGGSWPSKRGLTDVSANPPFSFWCRSRDLNPDERSSLPPQDSVSTRFHHFGTAIIPTGVTVTILGKMFGGNLPVK